METYRTLLLLLTLLASPAAARDFTCSNPDAEISCSAGKCEFKTASDGFTPMSLSRRGSTLSICAYSGCWEGPIAVRRTRGAIDLLLADVRKESGDRGAGDTLAVLYDGTGRSAQMSWGGFKNVMECQR